MLRSIAVLLFLTVFFTAKASAQDDTDNHWEVYAMASAMNGGTLQTSAKGFRIGGAWRPSRYLSLVADSGHYFPSGQGNGATTLTAGPRFYSHLFTDSILTHRRPWMIPYAQFMVGGQRTAVQGQSQEWSFAIAPGGGVDLLVADHVTFRIVEADVPLSSRSGAIRLSTGFSFNFGR